MGHQLCSTEFLSTMYFSYISSTSHSLAPNSLEAPSSTPVTWLDTADRPLSSACCSALQRIAPLGAAAAPAPPLRLTVHSVACCRQYEGLALKSCSFMRRSPCTTSPIRTSFSYRIDRPFRADWTCR